MSRLKQQVIIDNSSGAGGIVGKQTAAAMPPDAAGTMTSTAYGYLIDKQETPVHLIKSFMPVARAVSARAHCRFTRRCRRSYCAGQGGTLCVQLRIVGIGAAFPHMNTSSSS